MTNNLWGWGGEDNELYTRIKTAKMKVYRQTTADIFWQNSSRFVEVWPASIVTNYTITLRISQDFGKQNLWLTKFFVNLETFTMTEKFLLIFNVLNGLLQPWLKCLALTKICFVFSVRRNCMGFFPACTPRVCEHVGKEKLHVYFLSHQTLP